MTKHIAIDRKLIEDERKKLFDYASKATQAGESKANKAIEIKDGGDCFDLGLAATFGGVRDAIMNILKDQGTNLDVMSKALYGMINVWDETEEENRNSANFYTGSKTQASSTKTV